MAVFKVDELTDEELTKEINRLSKLAKERTLTKEESEYREKLRNKFRNNFREGLRKQLENTKVVDKHGHDVTPKKKKAN